jgi:integrase
VNAFSAYGITPRAPDAFVLEGRVLRAGIPLEATSRFSDPVWRLEPAQLQRHERALSLNFFAFPDPMRLAAKVFAYTLLKRGDPDEGQVAISTVRKRVDELRRFCNWLSDHEHPLEHVNADQILAYQIHLLTALTTPGARQTALSTVRMLWTYREHLGIWGLAVDPRDIPDFGLPQCKAGRIENRTTRIPEKVLGPLLVWALRFVDDFSGDIILGRDRRAALLAEKNTKLPPGEARSKLEEFLRAQELAGRPLPGFRGRPNAQRITQMAGAGRSKSVVHRRLIEKTAAIVGTDNVNSLHIPTTGRVHEQLWTTGIGTDDTHEMAVSRLARMLQAACYIVIAYLSGMRDSEIKHLKRGCLSVRRDEDGTPYRWLVTGRAFKGETNPDGVEANWVIGEPAARAVAALEKLHSTETSWLFAPIPLGPGTGPAKNSTTEAMVGTATINSLNEFMAWVNAYCASRDFRDSIPDVDGKPWHLTTRQFRRTLAWFIARRPGGVIAGAIAYRHHSITMFEGYAGTSASGFRAEVEAEEALARGEHLFNMIDQHQHRTATGPAAPDMEHRLDDLATAASNFEGSVVADPRRLRRLMAIADPQVFPSRYVTCVYDPDKALCHRKLSDTTQPSLGQCQPLDCRNVALTDDNRRQWEQEITDLDDALARRPTLPPLLRHRLQKRQRDIQQLLSAATRQSTP